MKNKKDKRKNSNKLHNTIECPVKIVKSKLPIKMDYREQFYLIFYREYSMLAFFPGDLTDREKVRLPRFIYFLSELKLVNYRIAQKLNNAEYSFFESDQTIEIFFDSEKKKDVISDLIKGLLKNRPALLEMEKDMKAYSMPELKYKLAKEVESESFEKHSDRYDYRYYLGFSFMKQFNNIYNRGTKEHKYYYNRFFIGKVRFINKANTLKKKHFNEKKIHKLIEKTVEPQLVVFLLSRGVYNLKNHPLREYSTLAADFTSDAYLSYWMDFDTIYAFKDKNIKQEQSNEFVPFNRIYQIEKAESIELIDTNKFTIKVEYKEDIDLLVFDNVIEAYKFYTYANILKRNYVEKGLSLLHDIKLNIRILFDDFRFDLVQNVIAILLEQYSAKYNKALALKKKIVYNEDEINFEAVVKFYEILLTAFYSHCEHQEYRKKMTVFVKKIHELYFDVMVNITSNQYTEVV